MEVTNRRHRPWDLFVPETLILIVMGSDDVREVVLSVWWLLRLCGCCSDCTVGCLGGVWVV
jgi:hypothetical protein